MDVLRERDEKDNLERQLHEEQKLRVNFQKRLRREKRTRKRLQDQIDLELNRRAQLEEALRNTGGADQIEQINEKIAQLQQQQQQQQQHQSQQQQQQQQPKPPTPSQIVQMHQSPLPPQSQGNMIRPPTPERIPERVDRIKQETEEVPQQYITARDMREQLPPPQLPQENKGWGYSGLDLINSGAAFWQNYSESLAQELEMERKSRQQQAERDVKSPLQDRTGYYKNSVLFTSSAT